MAGETVAPFSSRNRGAHVQIDRDFPESARVGLLHLLHEALEKRYLTGWRELLRELQRIARVAPESYAEAEAVASRILMDLSWDKVYDFCERLHSHLVQAVGYTDNDDNFHATTTKSEVQLYVSEELQKLFLEENLAFEFREGFVQRRGRRHTSDRISRAEVVLGDPRLENARKHYTKALGYFREVSKPDPENAVKEAVCSVEAAAKELFPDAKAATLGDFIKWFTGNEVGKIPKTLAQTFTGLYAFRSGGEGVAHGGATGGPATPEIAEYVLAVAASQIILLVDLANAQEDDIPF